MKVPRRANYARKSMTTIIAANMAEIKAGTSERVGMNGAAFSLFPSPLVGEGRSGGNCEDYEADKMRRLAAA